MIFVTNLRICELFLFNHTENRGVSRNNLCHDTFSLSRICEFANYFFLVTRRIAEYHGIIFVTNLRISELIFNHTGNHGESRKTKIR